MILFIQNVTPKITRAKLPQIAAFRFFPAASTLSPGVGIVAESTINQ
jgi:hypothetical protein